MLILLPPSETKHPGGSGRPLDVDALAFSSLAPQRHATVSALADLAADPAASRRALKLSERQLGEIDVNRRVAESGTMPAVDRFTGVLYDALDAASLPGRARAWLRENVAIQTALLGPVGALDAIPAFRLAAGHRIPALPPTKRLWADATTRAFADHGGPVLDLRSDAYRALGPAPDGSDHAFVRVVTESDDGEMRALNHFNKRAKGLFVRALSLASPALSSTGDVAQWAQSAGFRMRSSDAHEMLLVAPD